MINIIAVAGTQTVNPTYLDDILDDLAAPGAGDTESEQESARILLTAFAGQKVPELKTLRAAHTWARQRGHQIKVLGESKAAAKVTDDPGEITESADPVEDTLKLLSTAAAGGSTVHVITAWDGEHPPTGDWIYTLLDAEFAVKAISDSGVEDLLLEEESEPDDEGVTERTIQPADRPERQPELPSGDESSGQLGILDELAAATTILADEIRAGVTNLELLVKDVVAEYHSYPGPEPHSAAPRSAPPAPPQKAPDPDEPPF